MGITEFCVGFVICLIISVIFVIFGCFLNWITDDECGWFMVTILSNVGFGICLTYILYSNGIIK